MLLKSFFNHAKDKVRQFGEMSKEKGTTWQVDKVAPFTKKQVHKFI
jgi:hypothetical protein